MTTSQSMLADWPELVTWWQGTGTQTAPSDTGARILWRICACLNAGTDVASNVARVMDDEFGHGAAQHAFIKLHEFGVSKDVEVLDLLSEIGRQCLRQGEVGAFQQAVSRAAGKTKVAGLRFIAAWLALNDNRPADCIDECRLDDQDYPEILTIEGQALLELGKVREAKEALVSAVRVAPNELLAWFFLAKACLANKQPMQAWNAIQKCRRLAPDSEEIIFIAGMTAVEVDQDRVTTTAVQDILANFDRLKQHFPSVCVTIQLLTRTEQRDLCRDLLQRCGQGWELADMNDFKFLAPTLRALEAQRWMDESRTFLQLTQAANDLAS